MADATTTATATPAATIAGSTPASTTSGAGVHAPAKTNDKGWSGQTIALIIVGGVMSMFALMMLINKLSEVGKAFGFAGSIIAVGVLLITLSALGARLMGDKHSNRLMWVGIVAAGIGFIVLAFPIVQSWLTGSGVQTQTPLEQLLETMRQLGDQQSQQTWSEWFVGLVESLVKLISENFHEFFIGVALFLLLLTLFTPTGWVLRRLTSTTTWVIVAIMLVLYLWLGPERTETVRNNTADRFVELTKPETAAEKSARLEREALAKEEAAARRTAAEAGTVTLEDLPPQLGIIRLGEEKSGWVSPGVEYSFHVSGGPCYWLSAERNSVLKVKGANVKFTLKPGQEKQLMVVSVLRDGETKGTFTC